MTSLTEEFRFNDGDAFYAALVDRLDAIGDDGAVAYLGRLTLILANQVADQSVLLAALAAADAVGGDDDR